MLCQIDQIRLPLHHKSVCFNKRGTSTVRVWRHQGRTSQIFAIYCLRDWRETSPIAVNSPEIDEREEGVGGQDTEQAGDAVHVQHVGELHVEQECLQGGRHRQRHGVCRPRPGALPAGANGLRAWGKHCPVSGRNDLR